MVFNLARVSVVWRVGALLSLLAATLVAENLHAFQAEAADEAAAMLHTGIEVTATPLHATDTITVAVGFGFQRAYRVHYSFMDAEGRKWTGGGQLTEAEFASLTDPAAPDAVRGDARLAVVYDPADPTRNGPRTTYEAEPGPRLWMVIAAFVIVLGTGLVLTWRADRLRPRRDARDLVR